ERLKRKALSKDARLFAKDIRDQDAMHAAFKAARPEIVIHLAALAGVPPSLERPAAYMDVNVRGTACVLEAARVAGTQRFNLGGAHTTSLKGLVQLLEQTLNTKAILDRQPAQPGDVPLTSADVTHAKEVLGYAPRTPIKEGLKKFAEWIRGEGRDWV